MRTKKQKQRLHNIRSKSFGINTRFFCIKKLLFVGGSHKQEKPLQQMQTLQLYMYICIQLHSHLHRKRKLGNQFNALINDAASSEVTTHSIHFLKVPQFQCFQLQAFSFTSFVLFKLETCLMTQAWVCTKYTLSRQSDVADLSPTIDVTSATFSKTIRVV